MEKRRRVLLQTQRTEDFSNVCFLESFQVGRLSENAMDIWYRIWKKAVIVKKMKNAKDVLEKHLFYLDPVFVPGLLLLNEACCVISRKSMFDVPKNGAFELSEIVSTVINHKTAFEDVIILNKGRDLLSYRRFLNSQTKWRDL